VAKGVSTKIALGSSRQNVYVINQELPDRIGVWQKWLANVAFKTKALIQARTAAQRMPYSQYRRRSRAAAA
jgi:hypothetical protein